MSKLLIKYAGELEKETRSLHEIFTDEDFGMYRIIKKEDPDFNYIKDKGNPTDMKEFGGYTIQYVCLQKSLFQARLFNIPNTFLQINTEKKIITPTELHFGRSFGHVFKRFYFEGTHKEFMDQLKKEGYEYSDNKL